MYRTHFVQIRDTCSSTYAVGLPVCTNLESGAIQMLKSLSEQELDLSSFCLSYRLSAGPRRLHHINFQSGSKLCKHMKCQKGPEFPEIGLSFETCHDDKAPVVEWLSVAVSEVAETDGWWLFQIVTGLTDIC